MSDTENMPTDAVTEKIKVSEQYKEDALKQIKALVKGNQYDPDEVTVESFEGEILNFKAETKLHLFTKVFDKHVPGQLKGPVNVRDEVMAKEEMSKAYALIANDVAMERQIRDVILRRDDKGFALDKHIAPLNFAKKEFVIFVPCQTCKTTGTITCQHCHGKGVSPCPRCHGSGYDHCHHCHGAKMVAAQNGQKIQCPVCHGNGKIMCSQCQQQGTVKCKVCASRGVTKCPNCEGHAWSSRLFTQEVHLRTEFDYPKSKLPEKIVAMIERHGAKIKEHADVHVVKDKESVVNLDDADKQRRIQEAAQRGEISFPIVYEVVLPYGHVEYGIQGKSYYTFLFGTKGRLTHVSPFLDDLIKQGVRKLKDASVGRGDVAQNIVAAAQYRTVKEGIYYAARYGAGKARQYLKKTNRIGLSDDMAAHIIKLSNLAMRNITKKPRYIGLALCAALHCALIGGYFLSPLRSKIVGFVSNVQLHAIADAAIVIGSALFGIIIIQAVAQNAINHVMKEIVPEDKPNSITPKLGEVGYLNAGLSVVIGISVLEYMRMSGLGDVYWYNDLISRLLGQ